MKFNEKELGFFATRDDTVCEKRGVVWKRGERSGQGYRKRWFVLKGNLLFYFKAQEAVNEPNGCVVLERVSVAESGETSINGQRMYMFKLEFDGSNTRVYYLGCDTAEDRAAWMQKLKVASYEYNRLQLISLHQRLMELKKDGRTSFGESLYSHLNPEVAATPSFSAAQKFALTEEVVRTMSRAHSVSRPRKYGASMRSIRSTATNKASSALAHARSARSSISSTDRPVDAEAGEDTILKKFVCLKLAASKLPDLNDHAPNSYVSLLVREDTTDDRWRPYQEETEVVFGSKSPQYSTQIEYVYEEDSPDKRLCFVVSNIPEPPASRLPGEGDLYFNEHEFMTHADNLAASSISDAVGAIPGQSIIGLAECLLSEVVEGAGRSFRLALASVTADPAGQLLIEAEMIEKRVPKDFSQVPIDDTVCVRHDLLGARFNTLLNTSPFSEDFRFPTQRSSLHVIESMYESPFFYCIPIQLLNIYIEEDKQEIRELEDLGTLLGPVENVRAKHAHTRLRRVNLYTHHISFLDTCTDKFKASIHKKKQQYEMLGTNIHLQFIKVEKDMGMGLKRNKGPAPPRPPPPTASSGSSTTLMDDLCKARRDSKINNPLKMGSGAHAHYVTTTFGAGAAHSLSFKHGGLKRMLENRAAQFEQAAAEDEHLQIRSLLKTLRATKSQIDMQQRMLKDQLHAEKSDPDMLERIVSELTSLTQAIVSFFENDIIVRVHSKAAAARPAKVGAKNEWDASYLSQSIKDTFPSLQESIYRLVEQQTDETKSAVEDTMEIFHVVLKQACLEASECLLIVDLQSDTFLLHPPPDTIHRHDIVFSQMLAVLVSSFSVEFERRFEDHLYLEQLAHVGFLAQIESLLSTSGDEMGMIEDMCVGIKDMENVSFKFVPSENSMEPLLIGARYHIVVQFGIVKESFDKLPTVLKQGRGIPVRPVMFTQGVNEMQTLANKIGDTELQENINLENFQLLQNYMNRYLQFMKLHDPEIYMTDAKRLEQKIKELGQLINAKKSKNIEMLTVAQTLTRTMRGGRLTCCKSGKDRTSMSVTLEQGNLLRDRHGMKPDYLQEALDAMRFRGTRRENVYKNTGAKMYAFNKFQLQMLPKWLRPPIATIGSTVT